MSIKARILKLYAKHISRKIRKDASNAIYDQDRLFKYLITHGGRTKFGRDHRFHQIKSPEEFRHQVAVRDYEMLKSYIERIIAGENSVLWPGKPKYFAKTSGTTSGIKYIPITNNSIPNHIQTARNALFNILVQKNDFSVFEGKLIFLSGSPVLTLKGQIPTGRLSGIVNHEIPLWLKGNQLPSYKTNCIEDWEKKLDKIIEETHHADLRLISGIPPWVQMYFERLLEITGKSAITELYPNFLIFMYGGVNYAPYKLHLESLMGKQVQCIELYPASEGFIAFQDQLESEELLLNTNSGIYYEFVPTHEIHDENPTRLDLRQIELNTDYALIISNNAGLWAYNLGDTIKFVSKDPFRLIVTGRIKHFISAFGEHVIAKEVEESLLQQANVQGLKINEFTVAPKVNPPAGELPYHEWFVEFENAPEDLIDFAKKVDFNLTVRNIYYKDLIEGKILQPLKIRKLRKGAFIEYMKSEGKLGGQNKVPRLSNDRELANKLVDFVVQ